MYKLAPLAYQVSGLMDKPGQQIGAQSEKSPSGQKWRGFMRHASGSELFKLAALLYNWHIEFASFGLGHSSSYSRMVAH